MFKFVVLCSFLITGSLAFPTRIVNGTDAVPGQVPYIISLQIYGSHNCGGSILDATHVLTAAHCIDGSQNTEMYIQYGIVDLETKINRIRVSKKVMHEDYNPYNNYANDVAVLTLEQPIQFSEFAQPAVLPEQDEPIPELQPSMLAGWGYEKSGGSVQTILKTVNLRVYSSDECSARHSGQTDPRYHVCSGVDEGGKGQCSGDSGGPLYSGGKQIGVVSWSVKPCALVGYPGVFARVSSYVNWIRNKMTN